MRSLIEGSAVVLVVVACASCYRGATEMPPDVLPQNATKATAAGSVRKESTNPKDPLAYLDQFAAAPEGDAATAETLGACDTCHVDVVDEFTGSVHSDERVGCADCHGASDGHIADENNEVKPDRIFAHADVDRLCATCHECSRSRPVGPPAADHQVCTDCHAAHRLRPREEAVSDPPAASAANRLERTTGGKRPPLTSMPEPRAAA